MIENLVSSKSIRMLEQSLTFTERRHQVIIENIANADTPGYVQRDLPVKAFQAALRKSLAAGPAQTGDDEPSDIQPVEALEEPYPMAFHDRGVRNMEFQMSQLADNAMAHNMIAQLLRGKYDSISRAISMRV